MIIADTGPLVAMLNVEDKHHASCLDVLSRYNGPIIVPAPVVTEVAYPTAKGAGTGVEAAFLASLARRELLVEHTSDEDFARMAELVLQYADFPLGTADASVIATAERLNVRSIATLDHRHFHAVRPAHCAAFEILP